MGARRLSKPRDAPASLRIAPDFMVVAEPGDMILPGAHSLKGLNLRMDPVRKELTDAGPIITGAAAWVSARSIVPGCGWESLGRSRSLMKFGGSKAGRPLTGGQSRTGGWRPMTP